MRLEPAFPEKAVVAEGFEPRKQWEAALEGIGWLRENLDAAGREGQRLLVVGDGDFSVAEFRALFEPPVAAAGQRRRRGRRRKYGERAKRPDGWLAERSGWRRRELVVRGRRVPACFRVEGPTR